MFDLRLYWLDQYVLNITVNQSCPNAFHLVHQAAALDQMMHMALTVYCACMVVLRLQQLPSAIWRLWTLERASAADQLTCTICRK